MLDGVQRIITINLRKPEWIQQEDLELEDAFKVVYWRMQLDPTLFEEKCVAIGDFLQQFQYHRHSWAKIAYYSKCSDLVVFVHDIVTITNNPSRIDYGANSWENHW